MNYGQNNGNIIHIIGGDEVVNREAISVDSTSGFEFGDQLTTRERTAITLGPSFSAGFGNGGPSPPLAPPPARRPPPPPPLAGAGFNARFRTRICRKWEYSGCCPYGDKCLFAHGEAELQQYRGGWTPKNIVAASGSSVARADGSGSDRVPGVTERKVPKKINRIYGDWIDDDDE